MNSNMVKPENFGHLHLVYLFTVALSNQSTVYISFNLKAEVIRLQKKQIHNKFTQTNTFTATLQTIFSLF